MRPLTDKQRTMLRSSTGRLGGYVGRGQHRTAKNLMARGYVTMDVQERYSTKVYITEAGRQALRELEEA